jgi:hypothetical protein
VGYSAHGSCARDQTGAVVNPRHVRAVFRLRGRGVRASCVVVVVVVSLVRCAVAGAPPPHPPPQQAVALTDAGVVWYDNGRVVLVGAAGKRTLLRSGPADRFGGPPQIGSSSRAVALFALAGLQGGLPPARLRTLGGGTPVGGGGCQSWRPAIQGLVDFVVARDDLVVSATGLCTPTAGAAPQPLFVRNLSGGGWRVLDWFSSTAPPILAADGNLVALGVQQSLAAMRVRVIDVRNGSTRASFVLPDGYLAFAGPSRLVLSVPTFSSFPIGVRLTLAGATYGSLSVGGTYRVELYSARGRHLSSLGVDSQPPLASGSHLVTVNYDPSGQQTIAVQTLPNGPVRDVIGFNAPGRALVTAAFSWPRLALIQTTSPKLPNGKFNCQYGTYGPPTAPFLNTLNLARHGPFNAPPNAPPQPSEQQYIATCGPPTP